MRKTAIILFCVGAAAGLLSCASGPRHGQQAPPQPAPPPAPSQPAARPEVDSLPGEPRPAGQDQTEDVSLGLPRVPSAQPGPEVDTIPQPDSAQARAFPLAAPQAPAAAPRARTPEAARPPRKGEERPQAARPSRPAASGPQEAPAEPGPSPSAQAAQTAAATGAQAEPGQPYGKLREIYARPGDDVQISLDGVGFLFLGFPDRSPDGMSFKGKEIRDGKTWFTFKALKIGTYDLDFLQQDNSTGTSAKATVRVHVVSDADFAAAMSQGQQQPEQATQPGDPAFAQKLASLGQYDAAIAELLKGYREGNPQLNDQIARLYLRTGAYDAAGKYFSKNLAEQGQFGDSAVLGLVAVAIAQKDQPDFLSLLKRLLAVKDPALEPTLIAAARFEKDQRETGVGIDLASEYLARYPGGPSVDEAEYLLGRLLEADSPFQDIARARAMYKDLLGRFPESSFAPDAQKRVEYIDRHFFQIR